MGDNGIITNANLAKISTEFAGYKEEVEIFKTSKISENYNFKEDSLTAGQTTLEYEGKPVEETGNIKTIIQNLDDKYLDKFIIIKGILYLMVTDEVSNTEIKDAENTGIEIMPYEISEEGEFCFRTTSLSNVTIPKNLEIIKNCVFGSCSKLSEVKMQEGLKTIESSAFSNTNISELVFPSTLKTISGTAFSNCNNLDKFDLDNNKYFAYESGLLMTESKETIIYISSKSIQNLTTFEIPEGIESFTADISRYTNLKEITIPSSLNNINMQYLPTSIENIEVEDGNNKYISENGILYTNNNVLIGCYSKENNITIPEGIKVLQGRSFKFATNAEVVNLPDSLETIGGRTFEFNTKIKEINIGKNVSNIDSMFKNRNYSGVVNIDSENKYYEVEDNILYKKDEETGEKVILVSVLYEINGTIEIDSSIKELGTYSFYGQTKMTEISIPEGIETINNYAFNFCSRLIKVEIPSTVKAIGANCFADSTNNLEEIIIHNTEGSIQGAPWGAVKGMRVVQWGWIE